MLQIEGFCGAWRSGGLGLHLDWGQSQASLSQKPEAQPGSMRAHRGLELRIRDLLVHRLFLGTLPGLRAGGWGAGSSE